MGNFRSLWYYRNHKIHSLENDKWFNNLYDAVSWFGCESQYDLHKHIVNGVPVHGICTLVYKGCRVLSTSSNDISNKKGGIPTDIVGKRNRYDQHNKGGVRKKRVFVD
jgi:hypothetical protein